MIFAINQGLFALVTFGQRLRRCKRIAPQQTNYTRLPLPALEQITRGRH